MARSMAYLDEYSMCTCMCILLHRVVCVLYKCHLVKLDDSIVQVFSIFANFLSNYYRERSV